MSADPRRAYAPVGRTRREAAATVMDGIVIDAGEASLRRVLARPDIAPLLAGTALEVRHDLVEPFHCEGANCAALGPLALVPDAGQDVLIRHALELALMLRLVPDDPALAGLMAARVASLFAALEPDPASVAAAVPGLGEFAGASAPDLARLNRLWPRLVRFQSPAPDRILPATARSLAAVWPFLGPAEHLMGTGGDTRLRLDPASGLSIYGCSHRPRPWAITFASSTASSVSERGYAGAEAARRRLLGQALVVGPGESQRREAAAIKERLRRHYGLADGVQIVLTPSGTDGELCALTAALLGHPGRPLTNILIAPEETGGGVPLAATGRHFATATARGIAVEKGERIDGFPNDIKIASIPIRDDAGAVRSDDAIAADCRAAVSDARAAGRRVLVHVLDRSKTGIRAPAQDLALAADVDVVVDACQARLSAASVRRYLERGFMVLLTGSKFFTGPPFAGALLLPPAFASRFDRPCRVPEGLAAYAGRFDWLDAAPACAALPPEANLGLALRWAAALAEMEAFAAVPEDAAAAILRRFGEAVRAAIQANPDLVLLESGNPAESEPTSEWATLPTIFTFAMRAPGAEGRGRYALDPTDARLVYACLNSDLSDALPARSSERALAALRCHIGQPVALQDKTGTAIGALRICAGARLVSGEPSHAALSPDERLQGEIADMHRVVAKVSLVLRHLPLLRAAPPCPTYR